MCFNAIAASMKNSDTETIYNSDETYILVPKSWMREVLADQKKILAILENTGNGNSNMLGDYISEVEAKKLLGKKQTWFWNMRTSGMLASSKVGNKVYYLRADILNLLNKNYRQK
jgi:hypothetical protein